MAKTAAEMVTGALERARGRSVLVHWLGTSAGAFATYVVCSAESVDSAYRVTVKAAEYRCTCPAGDVGRRCWHQAAVYAVRATRSAWGLEPDGPSAAHERTDAAAELAAPAARVTPRRLPPRDEWAA
jgi:hypothetical protein